MYFDVRQAERVLVSQTKTRDQREAASKAIIADIFQRSFGHELSEMQADLKH